MPSQVLNQIKYLCRKISAVEWSGVLFYSIEGSIKDPANMVIILQHILPLHKGTSGYTEYDFDERVVEYMMENEQAEDWKIGHIHSHNNMGVFFSGTDWSELEDNAPNHNFYTSLIVNNRMEFCAKVCFIAETEPTDLKARDENGELYVYQEKTKTTQKKLVVYDCDIDSPPDIVVDEDFEKRVAQIIKDAEPKYPYYYQNGHVVGGGTATQVQGFGRHTPTLNPQPTSQNAKVANATKNTTTQGKGWSRTQVRREGSFSADFKNLSDAWDDENWHGNLVNDVDNTIDAKDEDMMENFAMYILNTGNDIEDYRDIEDLIEMYTEFGVNDRALASSILQKYPELFARFFVESSDRNSATKFIEVTSELIENYKMEIEITKNSKVPVMLRPVIDSLENMLKHFLKDGPKQVK